jgi:taurine transport system substrate-binding protein
VKLSKLLLAAAGALALFGAVSAQAADKSVVVGYQTDALPSSVAIADGEFDKATGYKIDFRRFNSGAEIFAAIASGDVQVGYVGSSPFAAATSRGLDVKAFYLASISGVDEASWCATARASIPSPILRARSSRPRPSPLITISCSR